MRKAIYRGSESDGRALLARAPFVHLATTTATGDPILRTFHAVLEDGGGAVAFHAAPAGEKMEGIGRRAVVSAEEVIASIPSYFVDPERACPATTYYVSVQAHGVLESVDDDADKARILRALMAKYQPEGGHVPLAADHPLYRKAIAGLLVARVEIESLTCKEKLGQNRTPETRVRILEELWKRGRPEDVRAIAMILARSSDLPTPPFLRVPHASGLRLSCSVDGDAVGEAVDLLHGVYWLAGLPRAEIQSAIERSTATVGARDERGRLVAFARAVSDGKVAWIYDVVVAEHARATGVGTAVMKLLLDHPAVRGARHVRLSTRDAMAFYRRLGFRELAEAPRHAWPSVEMIHPLRAPSVSRCLSD